MAEINLEAEQVVGEEEEKAPTKRGGKMSTKLLLVVGGILIVEAVILVSVFNIMVSSGSAVATSGSGDEQLEMDWGKHYGELAGLDLGSVKIFDGSSPDIRSERYFAVDIKVVLTKESFDKIQQLTAENEAVLDLVKDDFRKLCTKYLLRQGLQALKSQDFQLNLGARLKTELNDRERNPRFANQVKEVIAENGRVSNF